MFEFIEKLSIDVASSSSRGQAYISHQLPLFADHFSNHPVLPGSMLIELAGQVSGPLAEEIVHRRNGTHRWAFISMVQNAKFLNPVKLPAQIEVRAELLRMERSHLVFKSEAFVNHTPVFRGEIVHTMMEGRELLQDTIEERYKRLQQWL